MMGPVRFSILSFLLLACTAVLWPHDVLMVHSVETKISLSPYISYFEDPSRVYGVEDFRNGLDNLFVPAQEKDLMVGYNHSGYWFRFQIQNKSGQEFTWFVDQNDPYAKVFDIYILDTEGRIKVIQSGTMVPFTQRDVAHKDMVFRLNLRPDEIKTVYIYAKNDPLHVDLSLWSPAAFQSRVQNEYLIFGMFFGVLLVIFIYNCYLFYSLGDRSYFWYIVYLIAIIAFHVSMTFLGFEFLWPNAPYWNQVAQNLLPAAAFFFACAFTLQFLDAKRNLRYFRFILYAYMVMSLVIALASVFSTDWVFNRVCLVLLNVQMAGCPVAFTVAALMAYKKRFRPARYHGLGFAVLLTSIFLYGLKEQGILPTTYWSVYIIQIGTAVQVIFLSFALSERINVLKEELQESQKTAIRNLEKADYLKDEFLANTSHELRTPLHGIIGLAESLWESSSSVNCSPSMKENLVMIISSARRLALLVDDILDFSKLRKHELVIASQPVSLVSVVRTAFSILNHSAEAKKIVLKNDLPEGMPAVLGDFNRLQQIIINLVGNAIKFTPAGGQITVTAQVENGQVQVGVQDTGIGIAKEHFDKIFHSFEQVEASISRSYGGTGIGLAITKKLVELHQGRIWFESELGRGSTFFFTLKTTDQPALPDLVLNVNNRPHIVTLGKEFPEVPTAVLAPDAAGWRIMTVDDELVNQKVLKSQLSAGQFQTIQVMSGQEALALLEAEPLPDLILLDLMLPKMSGFEVCRKIREKHSLLELPVILITAKNTESDLIQGFEAGANDYITKPCPKGELLARIRLHILMAKLNRGTAQPT